MPWKRYLPVVFFVLLVILAQIFISLADANFILTQLTMSLYYALIAVGMSLLMGYAGQISIGHAGFFGIGAYVQAALTTANLTSLKGTGLVGFMHSLGLLIEGTNPYGEAILYCSPWIALPIALVITAVVAFLIGIPVLKLKGHYLAMATLGFGLIIHGLVRSLDVFGSADGLSAVPPFTLFPGVEVSGRMDARIGNYYIAAAVLVIGLTIAMHLVNSRVGRALRAIHGNEMAACSLGINAGRYKLYTFVVSALFAALGGALLVHFNAAIGPTDIDVSKSVRFVAVVAAGGVDSLWGVLYMGIFLNFISLRQWFGEFDHIVFACILIVIMLFAPRGLIRFSYLEAIRARFRKRRRAA